MKNGQEKKGKNNCKKKILKNKIINEENDVERKVKRKRYRKKKQGNYKQTKQGIKQDENIIKGTQGK